MQNIDHKKNIYKMQNIDPLINLIKAVKNHPKLFKNFADSDDDLKEWIAVSQECKITTTEAQDKWNLLLLGYVEYLKNNQDFTLAQHMDFLQPYFFSINDSENIDEDELLKAIDYKRLEENLIQEESIEGKHKRLKIITSEESFKNEHMENNNISPITFTEKMFEPEAESSTVMSDSPIINLTSLELIFLGYAKQLQKMPLSLQVKTKRKIADIMDEAELQMIY